MIFKCYLCSKYTFWSNKTCYEVHITRHDGKDLLLQKKICGSCGDQINQTYEYGMKEAEIADMETNEIE